MSATRLAVVGASGRMGRAVVRLAPAHGFDVVCEVSEGDSPAKLRASRAAVLVDFSSPSATVAVAEAAADAGIAIVSGTTGLDDAGRAALDAASARVAVVWEPNMSVGVHVLTEIVRRAVAMLGSGAPGDGGEPWDIEIVEAHHRLKVDAPSGTALRLAEAARAARAGTRLVHGREGRPGARDASEIGMHALRGGDVIGDHTVHLLGPGERIELTHRASSRELFAGGALRVARFCAGRAAGRYAMADLFRA